MNQKDLIIDKKYAEIHEHPDVENENVIRIYCCQYPNHFTFQIRTKNPLPYYNKGKTRNLIANVILSIDEVEMILAYMKKEKINKN